MKIKTKIKVYLYIISKYIHNNNKFKNFKKYNSKFSTAERLNEVSPLVWYT